MRDAHWKQGISLLRCACYGAAAIKLREMPQVAEMGIETYRGWASIAILYTIAKGRLRMNAAAYLRCSGDSQIGGDTWDRQRERINAFAASHGFTIEHEWREEGVSGKVDCNQRPAFQAMLASLLANGCRTIIVEDLSRLARKYAVQEQILLYLCSKGITLWSCANGGDNITEAMSADPTRRLVIGMMGLISQWEREQIVAKLRAARDRKRAREGRCGGVAPYGSTEHEARALELIQQARRDGLTLANIAHYMNNLGEPSRNGKQWHAGTICKILRRANVTA